METDSENLRTIHNITVESKCCRGKIDLNSETMLTSDEGSVSSFSEASGSSVEKNCQMENSQLSQHKLTLDSNSTCSESLTSSFDSDTASWTVTQVETKTHSEAQSKLELDEIYVQPMQVRPEYHKSVENSSIFGKPIILKKFIRSMSQFAGQADTELCFEFDAKHGGSSRKNRGWLSLSTLESRTKLPISIWKLHHFCYVWHVKFTQILRKVCHKSRNCVRSIFQYFLNMRWEFIFDYLICLMILTLAFCLIKFIWSLPILSFLGQILINLKKSEVIGEIF